MVRDEQYDLDLEDREWEADQAYYAASGRSPGSYLSSGFLSDQYGFHPICKHPPQCLLKSESAGWEIWAGARFDCLDYLPYFHMILNLSGDAALEGHYFPMKELARWSAASRPQEAVIDWPDMGVVTLPCQFWKDLVQYLASHKTRLLIFCVGGHGRTGTAIACLLVACGWDSGEAVRWIRHHYCASAIESKAQEAYIREIEAGCSAEREPEHIRSKTAKSSARGGKNDGKEADRRTGSPEHSQ